MLYQGEILELALELQQLFPLLLVLLQRIRHLLADHLFDLENVHLKQIFFFLLIGLLDCHIYMIKILFFLLFNFGILKYDISKC